MLQERYDVAYLREHLLPTARWRPFPPASDRAAWEALLAEPLHREQRAYLVGQAEALLGQPWPDLPATLYMEFVRNGNRSRFERPYFARRRNLGTLVLAECLEYQGRFLDEIINGLWAITGEATWTIPACARNAPDPLPDQDVPVVALFSAETSMVLAEARYLLHDELAAISPAIVRRVQRETIERVIAEVEARDDFWWFEGRNNWTPWIASNVLGAGFYLLDDPDRIARLAFKLMGLVDNFIAHYGPDGGCDEGPSYWGVAAGMMLNFLEHLHSRSEGAIDVYGEPLIDAMGRFIVDTHLAGPWFTNFADAPARLALRRAATYRYGERIGSQRMKDAVLLSARNWDPTGPVDPPLSLGGGGSLNSALREIFWIPADAQVSGTRRDLRNWFPDLQVLVVRESEVLGEGLVLAAKGGHNGESHNHNDLGQFIVMLDGQPAVVDIGVETYTRQTFSPERYDIWCIRSRGHNVPLVNGQEQLPGAEHRATEVVYASEDGTERLGMQIEGAYPPEAGLQTLRREFTYRRDGTARIAVEDTFALRTGPARIEIPLFTLPEVQEVAPGTLAICTAPRRLLVRFDPERFRAEIDRVPIEDARLQSSWGDHLQRITLTYTSEEAQGAYTLSFEPER